jgi:adenine C2-methylase RlmN of 23S rRNA A2503 and tRNA A37
MRHDIRLKHLSFIYDFRDTAREIEFRKMASDVGEAIRLEGVLARDQEPIAWVTYQDLLVAEERVVIGLASTVGCVGRCKICNSGLRTLRRVLSVKEMLAQFLIAVLRSPHTKGLFERPMDLTVNWTCEGEPGSNLDNVHEAMRILSNLRMMDMKFVITTMGNQSFLKKFLRKYTHLPNLFYWSLNFRPEVRRLLMPYTADHSAVAIRDTFREICQKQGTTLTVAWPVGHGINDGDKDVLFLKEIAGEPWQEVKLTLLNPDTVRLPFGLKHLKEQMFSTTQAHMDRFADKLEAAGIAYRKRRLVGLGFPAGTCGSTIPTAPQKGISKTPSPLGT